MRDLLALLAEAGIDSVAKDALNWMGNLMVFLLVSLGIISFWATYLSYLVR